MGTGALSSPLLTSFRDSYRDLLRYLSHRTGSADEARDVAHDTWVRLADMNLRGEQPALCDSEARAYVFAMARNLVIDRQRHAGVVARHAQSQALPLGDAGGAQHVPDACESLMYRQAVDMLEAALATVPDRARQVFLRHRVNGEDQGTLAAEYGISRNMVERDMMLAMDRVQVAMEHWHAAGRAPGTGAAHSAVRGTGRRRSLAALLGVAGIGLAGGLGAWRWWRMAVADWQQVASTGHGKTLRHPLPDGSHITLDAQSRVHMAYYAGQRRVTLLAGAVFFDVVRDVDRPFVVEVPDNANGAAVRVTVLGTRFGVERGAGGGDVQGQVEVQVEEGRVRVQSLGPDGQVTATRELTDGEAMRVAPGEPLPASPASTHEAAAWRHGVVAFTDTPLADAVERLRRYLPRAVWVDADAAALRLSGQVRIAQAEDFVRALPAVVPVQVQLVAGQWQVQAR
ncbi:MAG: sigma-70 family RNA polymerase sigma factor [Gammaproteobacteria bacterium]|nr:sigma-70 family RNA polymerase sigma factor [Gammaproteobacteria bacterium]MBU1505461.1 sigma-70 family RNA polymerase sigma factor [Gammaproteobacteria bacterium]MBU2123167.1 sigma-70 family RNA polymerase sigma factor [Gammaproteobacteria bacterium]MBU2170693.1 sigma-70 family RNA polymerase sigma factor [Gammaproteobacteria bacterium]MBU2199927.1 sigma-70 family RNA polymerase sigma factor [Gammaproteobacteria bacterium]